MTQKILLIVLVLFIVGIGSGALSSQQPYQYSQDAYLAPALQKTKGVIAIQKSSTTPIKAPIARATAPQTEAVIAPEPPTVVRMVAKKTQTVLETMQYERSIGKINFTSHAYPSLGDFVDSVEGRKNEGGMYWFLYVNGTSSDLGASQKQVAPGDVIEWRYETRK